MPELLKGNFTPKKQVSAKEIEMDLESRFEREALKRLGGSIAFADPAAELPAAELPGAAE